MNAAIEEKNATRSQNACNVVVVYDDVTSRTRALTICDYLVGQNWENVELKFHWWRTDFLEDPKLADLAVRNATDSDFLIICTGQNQTNSPLLKAWFESWINKRQGLEGALIDLSAPGYSNNGPWKNLLRKMCTQGRFDYLTPAPAQPTKESPKAIEIVPAAIASRNRHVQPPSHHGLNE